MNSGEDFKTFLTIYPQPDGIEKVFDLIRKSSLIVTKNLVTIIRMFEDNLNKNIDGLTSILEKKYQENKISPYRAFYSLAHHRMSIAYGMASDLLFEKKAFIKRLSEDTPQGSKIVTDDLGRSLKLQIENKKEQLTEQLNQIAKKIIKYYVQVDDEKEIPNVYEKVQPNYDRIAWSIKIDPKIGYVILQYQVTSDVHNICATMLEEEKFTPRIVPAEIQLWCFKGK